MSTQHRTPHRNDDSDPRAQDQRHAQQPDEPGQPGREKKAPHRDNDEEE
ncbi:hypothetical protein [Stenotrophomonas terrae]|nr:hypothetical protein [Stenotrophomonas terrae]